MSRLAASLWTQVVYQHRNGFYVASMITIAMFVALLAVLPETLDAATRRVLFAVFTVFAVQITTFFFVGGVLLLERGEGVLSALAVSPLKTGEFVIARTVTLAALATLETAVIVSALARVEINAALFLAGAGSLSLLLAFAGVLFFARYGTLNEALPPSVLATVGLSLPVLGLAWPSPVWNAHPTYATMQLVGAGFGMAQFGVLEALSLTGWMAAAFFAARAAAGRLLAAAHLQ
jgi:fluoroquinolone transport system permease protein